MFRFVSFRCRAQVLIAAAGAFSFTAATNADPRPGYAVGQGNNTSALVIDFDFIGGDQYYFEYYYDGPATAEQMLLDLNTAGDLTVDFQYFTFGGSTSIFINGFSFDGNTAVPTFEGSAGESWSYYASEDRSNHPIDWTGLNVGPTDRELTDGTIDGWTLNVSAFNSKELEPTYNTPTPFSEQDVAQVSSQLEVYQVPEPASAVLLALAGTVLMRRRRN